MYLSLELKEFDDLEITLSESANSRFRNKSKAIFNDLERYILDENNVLDATAIQEHLFPAIDSDIFLSHAHADEDKVISLAVYLEKIGFKVFVDSCLWGNVFDLLKTIDEEHCKFKGSTTYNYQKRNFSTANVYMILNAALHHMIQKSELFIFLGTEESLTVKDSIENQESLKSPWIFSELTFVNQVVRHDNRPYLRPRKVVKSTKFEDAQVALDEHLEFRFNKPTLDFSLSNDDLCYWSENWPELAQAKEELNACNRHIKALEILYDVMKERAEKRQGAIVQQYIDL